MKITHMTKYDLKFQIYVCMITFLIIFGMWFLVIKPSIVNTTKDYDFLGYIIPLIILLSLPSVLGGIFLIHTIKKKSNIIEKIKIQKMAELGQITSQIIHDIRNPLSIISNEVEILSITNKESSAESIERLQKAVYRINEYVENLLAFVKTDKDNLRPCSLNEAIKSSIGYIDIPKTTKVSFPEKDFAVFAEKNKLAQVFENLIKNAIDAINGIGKIEIRTSEQNKHIIIEIEDSGREVLKENIGKFFQPLFTTKKQGIGLGLSSVRTIIDSFGGTISVSSPPTIFKINLHRADYVQ